MVGNSVELEFVMKIRGRLFVVSLAPAGAEQMLKVRYNVDSEEFGGWMYTAVAEVAIGRASK